MACAMSFLHHWDIVVVNKESSREKFKQESLSALQIITWVCESDCQFLIHPNTNLCPCGHLAHKILHDDVCELLQQAMACLGVPVEPAFGLGVGGGASTLYHICHQGPLSRGKHTHSIIWPDACNSQAFRYITTSAVSAKFCILIYYKYHCCLNTLQPCCLVSTVLYLHGYCLSTPLTMSESNSERLPQLHVIVFIISCWQ